MALSSFLRRLSGDPHRPLLPQHADPPSSSTYSLHPLPPQQPPTHPPSQPNMPSSTAQPTTPSSPPAPIPVLAPLPPSLLPLHRHASHLQHHLQSLLDAQSAGLLAGLARAPSPASSSSTTTTTTASDRTPKRSPAVVPVRQPVPKAIGLRGARRGIAAALLELRGVKGEEGGVLEAEVRRREEGLATVRGFEAKRAGLEAEMARVLDGEARARVEGLRAEKGEVEAEVRGLEERVGELRARAGWLGREIAAGENERESGLSSWREAGRGVDGAVERFLRGLPRGEGGVGALPVGRRTLQMCREEWEGEREGLVRRREGVVREREALEEGVRVWEEVVGVVAGVEALLRDEMRRQGGGGAEAMRGILEQMDRAVETLEGRVQLAQTRGWNLLVCAVGAELEAFREGRDVLHAALDAAGGNEGSGADGGGYGAEEYKDTGVENGNEKTAVDEDFGSLSLGGVPIQEHRVRPPSLLDRSEDEDDGPGPEFLTSHQEEDE